jgi:co-chaperonin GroES (HSP10)
MSVVVPHRAVEAISTAKDPKKTILDLLGDLSGIEILGEMVLVATYIRPEKTAGGIIRPTSNTQEDVWQGKVGLVVKLGTDAFIDPETGIAFEESVTVGDWCVYKIGDGWSMNVRGVGCRLVRDTGIRMRVEDPNIIL